MDYAACHVVYVDKRVSRELEGKYVHRSATMPPDSAASRQVEASQDRISETLLREIEYVRINVQSLLSVFDGGKS